MANTITALRGGQGHWWGLKLLQASTPSGMLSALDYGVTGNGVTDDTDALAAAAATAVAAGKSLWIPLGTYRLASLLHVPAGARLRGVSLDHAHLKGCVAFDSDSVFSHLKIGDAGCAIRNAGYTVQNHPSNVEFEFCQFRGGPSTQGDADEIIKLLWYLENVEFRDCNIECHQGTYTGTEHYDNVMIQPGTVAPSIHDVNFLRCTFGVWNGVDIGHKRMHVEICPDFWNAVRTTCYHDINFDGCTFEPGSGWGQSLDYCGCSSSSDDYTSIAGNSHVLDCLFKGNLADAPQLNIESLIEHIEVGRNTFWPGVGQALCFGNNTDDQGEGDIPDYPSYHYGHDNIIDYSYDNGLTCTSQHIVTISGKGNRFIDNTLLNKFGAVWPAAGMWVALLVQNNTTDNIVESNTITQSPAASYAVRLGTGSTGNYVRYNTLTGGGIDDWNPGNNITTPNP